MTIRSCADRGSVTEEQGVELELSEYQEVLRATTRAFLEAECPVTAVRALADDPRGFDPDSWKAGAALGWTSLLVDPADGGGSVSGNGISDLVIVAEELGRMVAAGPFVPANVVAAALASWGNQARRRATLGGIVAGDLVAAWAHDETAGLAPTRLEPGRSGTYVLTGHKAPVEAGAQADVLLVSALAEAGPVQVVVPADAPGVTVTPRGSLDLVRRFADVHFEGVTVSPDDLVGTPDEAVADIERQRSIAVVLQCAETVGALDRIFGITLGALSDRYSFGRVLASYQALKHRCADMKLRLESCQATATAAARSLAAGEPDAGELASVAKAWIGPVATELVQDCVQLHGGIGVTYEHDIHLYLRRITVDRLTYGTPADHHRRIGELRIAQAA